VRHCTNATEALRVLRRAVEVRRKKSARGTYEKTTVQLERAIGWLQEGAEPGKVE
jgi:hypothetical protein